MAVVLCLLIIATSTFTQAELPIAKVIQGPVLAKLSEETLDAAPQYSFAYDVQDAATGDSKTHVENRNGDVVQGQYSLNDPDGTRRIVEYTADPVNGFKAVVKKAPFVAIKEPVVVEQRSVVAEPLLAKTVVAEPLVARAIAAPLIARTSSLRSASGRLARLEDDSVVVDVETFPASPAVSAAPAAVPVAPFVPTIPVRRIATANSVSYQYFASPVLTYPRIAAPIKYAIV